MTPWQSHRRTRYAEATAAAVAVLGLVLWLTPNGVWRWLFSKDFQTVAPPAERDVAAAWIRLLPSPEPTHDPRAPREVGPQVERAVSRPVLEPQPPSSGTGSPWAFDPTTAWSARGEIESPLPPAPAVADSVALTADFLRSLTLTDLDRVIAMIDTSQVALAHDQFHWLDRTIVERWRAIWIGEGAARRAADIYERAVVEAEEEGM